MKKITVLSLFIASFLLAKTSFAQEGWVKQNVGGRVSVKFPKAPTKNASSFEATSSDSTFFTVNMLDMGPFGLDSALLTQMAPTEEFAEQFKTGMVAKFPPGSELVKMDIVTWKGYTAYDIEANITAKGKTAKSFTKCIFIGSHMYMFLAVTVTNSLASKDAFFNSITLD